MNKSPNIFDIYDIIYVIFEYTKFDLAYMLYNRAFYKLAKTRQITLKSNGVAHALNSQMFEQYKQLFINVLSVYGMQTVIRDCKNVIGLGICLYNSILNIKIPLKHFHYIKILHVKFNSPCETLLFTRHFPSLKEATFTCQNLSSPNDRRTLLLRDGPIPCDQIHAINNIYYVKKTSVDFFGRVVCTPSDVVEYLSISAGSVYFAPFGDTHHKFTKLKHLVLNVYQERMHFDISHIDMPHLETLEFTSNVNLINLFSFTSLKKIIVVYNEQHFTNKSELQFLRRLLLHNIPSFDLVISSCASDIYDLCKFCNENGIRVLYE